MKNLILNDCINLQKINIRSNLNILSVENCKKLAEVNIDFVSLQHFLQFGNFVGAEKYPDKEINNLIS